MDRKHHVSRIGALTTVVTLLFARLGLAADTPPASSLSPETLTRIDAAAAEVLKKTGAPSASIAIVRDGRTAYLRAYGKAGLEPKLPAEPDMRYAIGSVSKQFTAAAILLLQQDGRLSLDDRVAKYLPELTRADDIERASRHKFLPAGMSCAGCDLTVNVGPPRAAFCSLAELDSEQTSAGRQRSPARRRYRQYRIAAIAFPPLEYSRSRTCLRPS
jgi:CubicO group peptidase (beta-lactamase class C family)